jgi:hypothetical protein
MLDREKTFIIHGDYADKVIVVDSRESKPKGLDCITKGTKVNSKTLTLTKHCTLHEAP